MQAIVLPSWRLFLNSSRLHKVEYGGVESEEEVDLHRSNSGPTQVYILIGPKKEEGDMEMYIATSIGSSGTHHSAG